MRESRTSGSVRGAASNRRPYRDPYISPYIDFRDGPRGRAGNDRLARETSLGRGLAQSCANWGVIAF